MNYAEESLKKHGEWKGKLEVVSRVPVSTKDDLSLAYTPGVAEPCLEIQKDVEKSYEYTRRWNTCLVVTDGTAVLGLGDIGPEAGLPVMEGKSVLFKTFGNIDSYPLCIRSKDTEEAALCVSDSLGIYFVPAFVGMGTPYWDNESRGAIFGLSRGAKKEHLIRATLEGIAYEALDVLEVMESEANINIPSISVDGGASSNNFMIQFESDITNKRLIRPAELETTALGAAYLAGLYTGFFESFDEIIKTHEVDKIFMPNMDKKKIISLISSIFKFPCLTKLAISFSLEAEYDSLFSTAQSSSLRIASNEDSSA